MKLGSKTFLAPIALALLAMPVAACSFNWSSDDEQDDSSGVAATGSGGTRTYTVSDFDSVGLAAGGDVEVRVGPAFSVTATGDPATLDKIRVERKGSSLSLGWKRGINWNGTGKVRYLVTMPRITGADIGGSGTITVDKAEGDKFEGNIGGSGKLDIRGMKVDKAGFAIGGSGDIAAAGTARSLEISVGGSGNVRAQPLRTETAEVNIAGAGDVQATATRTAEINILGSGDVTITGGAKCEVSKMGSGKVHCG